MAYEIEETDQAWSKDDAGVERRGLLRVGTLITALTGASAISAMGAGSAQAAVGDTPLPSEYVSIAEKGAPMGVAALDQDARIMPAQLPDLAATYGEQLCTLNTPARAAVERMRIAPSLSPMTERTEPLRIVMFQSKGVAYATYSRAGEGPAFQKSTNGGTTWTNLSTLPATPSVVAKLKSGTFLAIEQTATTTVGGSNPRVWRSTDDGLTWNLVTAGLKFGPLSAQGVCEGTDGSVMIAEYGNVAPHQYRLMRSTDDGVTWRATFTSDGTEPQYDPGHLHSVTYDKIAGKHVIFCDRPNTGTSGPRIYASGDNGATWKLLGESITADYPNFVAPMYFADYIAWGSDNQVNGRISRMKRTDFYAGNFDKAETVAQLSQKVFYFVFPIRDDVWAITVAGEFIGGVQSGGPGSTMNEVWLVSDNGSLVSGGMESYYSLTDPGSLSGVRASVPHRFYDQTEHAGFLWVNMPIGRPRPYAAVPVTQGWEPPSKRVNLKAMPFLPPRVPLTMHRSSMAPDDVVRFLEYTGAQVVAANDVASGAVRAEIRWTDGGGINFTIGGVVVATLPPGGAALQFNTRLDLTTTGVGVRTGTGSPEGIVTAPQGTLYLNYSGGRAVSAWIKEAGGSTNTGWAPIGHPHGATANRPTVTTAGMQYYDDTLDKPIWRNATNTAWRDATGTTV
jgi:hypothetical protein